MEMIAVLVGLFVVLTALVLPWLNHTRIKALSAELRQLQREMGSLRALPPQTDTAASARAEDISPAPEVSTPAAPDFVAAAAPAWHDDPIHLKPAQSETHTPRPSPALRPDLEQAFGTRLPVWGGGLALALAGLFLVKYSIDNALLSPLVRVILGGLLGGGLLFAADRVRQRADFANGTRIAQSLSGAGIAVLYVALFAATRLYDLIPALVGFVGMAAVTLSAVVLALRHGAPIALLGLVGGFLTPALVGSDTPSAPLLFLYLFGIFSALMLVIGRQGWWRLALPTLTGAVGWVIAWLAHGLTPGDSLWLTLFLLGVSAVIVWQTRGLPAAASHPAARIQLALRVLGLGSVLVLMGVVTSQADFGLAEFGLFGLLAAGGMGLAVFAPRQYRFVPWTALGVTGVMLAVWPMPDTTTFVLVLGLFALLYTGGGYGLMRCTPLALCWSGLAVASALGLYLLAYARLHTVAGVADVPLLWGGVALALAALATRGLQEVRRWGDDPVWKPVVALFAAAAPAFFALALTVELPREFLSVALAAEMTAVAWLAGRLQLPVLRQVCGVLALAFAVLLLPQILLLVQLSAYSLFEAEIPLQSSLPIVQWPLFQLGVPAALFVGASVLLRREQDGRLIATFEGATVALFGVMAYYLSRHAFHPDADMLFVVAGFLERGLITNGLFLYGLACLAIGRRFDRWALATGGTVLCAVALFRICWFDLLLQNPLWAAAQIDGWPLLNTLLLPFGLPLLWSQPFVRDLTARDLTTGARMVRGWQLCAVFALVSLNVRLWFHPDSLEITNGAETAEIYAYSAAWGLLGLGLLLTGVRQQDKLLRYTALGLMTLTAGKVFLYDVSALEGLYRVFAFFGLGLSLLGLSWIYTRFVFPDPSARAGDPR